MKGRMRSIGVLICIIVFCFVGVSGCGDDDDNNPASSSIEKRDPSHGFLLNSTSHRIILDIGEKKEFRTTLEPGELKSINLQKNRTHLVHAVLVNTNDRAISDYVNSFYIDEVAADNQLKDFICSWYIEFTSESGFHNRFGN